MRYIHVLNRIHILPFLFVWLLTMNHKAAAGSRSGSTQGAPPANAAPAIPWDQIGAKAEAHYQGDGLTVTPAAAGAWLHCVFQQLDGEATREGLWLTSTVTNQANDRFRLKAAAVGRKVERASLLPYPHSQVMVEAGGTHALLSALLSDWPGEGTFPAQGSVSVEEQTVRWSRPGLVEEYSVSMDGVRQDFLVTERPSGTEELAVQLEVVGAKVEAMPGGARLVLPQSGRKIAYSRLRATDATGRELPARIEAHQNCGIRNPQSAMTLAIVVDDAGAAYPVRIDPTFSDANWVSLGGLPGTDGTVYATAIGGSGNLYIGGLFTVAGDVIATNIAQWDGNKWSALGSAMNGSVLALAISGGTLYAGGYFTAAGTNRFGYIAQWNGSSWSGLGSGMDYIVDALAVSGGTLYAGGNFTRAGGNAARYIAQWNGNSWSPLGAGMDDEVSALTVSGSNLYAGGYFTTATNSGGAAVTVNSIARWNGSNWSALGSGLNGPVLALAISGGTLYAGGYFTTSGDGSQTLNYIAQWNGSSWSALGSGMSSTVFALAMSGGKLYAGGYFTTAGGNAANGIAQWNGSSWSALGSGMGDVYALAVSGGTLYVGGPFSTAGDNAANNIAQWNGSSWSALGSGTGMNNYVRALAVSGGTLYAGGLFTWAGGNAANYIAQWNGSSWSPLGSGMNGSVLALAMSGGTLYAGGYFTTAGGNAAKDIAQWNGSSWSALGSGVNNQVNALAVSGGMLYAGGTFTTAGGNAAKYIAQWNGSSWSPLGSGIGGVSYPWVNALAVSGGTLYAGGIFTTAGGNAATNIAQWNGSSWSPLGSGMGGTSVEALAMSGGTLYAGGYFTNAGGNAANNIAQWNGSSWSPLGSGIGGLVYALAVSGTNLYAGGPFTTAGGNPAKNIAQWNGSSWSALGSGMGARSGSGTYVYALAVSGTTLYAGGLFTMAGGKVSAYAAEALIRWPAFSSAPVRNADGSVTLNLATLPQTTNRLHAATNLTPPVGWQPIYTNVTGGLWQFTDTNTAAYESKFYRLSTP